jgi:glycosyltransferase involved in cell wall biosynthesis
MQKIFINGRFLSQQITGVQRVALEVVKSLDNLIKLGVIDNRLYSFTMLAEKNLKYKPDLKNIEIEQVGKLSGHLWEQVELPRYVRKNVLLNLCGPAPVFKRNQVAVIHDAVPFACPAEFSLAFRTWYKILFAMLGKRTDELITVSDFSKKELSHYCRVDEERFTVAHLGIDHFTSIPADTAVLKRNDLFGRKYILAVGSLSPRKNFLRLIDTVKILDDPEIELVVAGGINSKVFSDIDLQPSDRIRYLGRVGDEELKALYSNAFCFAFPSLYEGFGLPPLEAMSCGCPVVAGNSTSIPEVCGEAALYCDPNDSGDIAEKIRSLSTDDCLRKRLISKGIERAALYTWNSCGRTVWSAVERLFEEERDKDESRYAPAV